MKELNHDMSGEESSIIYNAAVSIGIGSIVAAGLIGIAKISSNLRKKITSKK